MPSLEVITSIALTAMSTVVAAVALVFSYRQNVGWRPVVLVTNSNMSGVGGSWRFTLRVNVEFWNRRKYPVAVRLLRADIGGVTILNADGSDDPPTHTRDNTVRQRLDVLVDPHVSGRFSVEVVFEDQSLDAVRPLFDISVHYFDPYRNREASLNVKHKFFYPEMGWMKDEEQRAKCIQAFEDLRSAQKGGSTTS